MDTPPHPASQATEMDQLLVAGRDLFTLLDRLPLPHEIEQRAGLPAGAFLASFADPEGFICALIVREMGEDLTAVRHAVARNPGRIWEELHTIVWCLYHRAAQNKPLLRMAVGMSWTWRHEYELKGRAGIAPCLAFLQQRLENACDRGELQPDAPTSQLTGILFTVFNEGLRRCVHDDWSVAALTDAFMTRAHIILGSSLTAKGRRRPSPASAE